MFRPRSDNLSAHSERCALYFKKLRFFRKGQPSSIVSASTADIEERKKNSAWLDKHFTWKRVCLGDVKKKDAVLDEEDKSGTSLKMADYGRMTHSFLGGLTNTTGNECANGKWSVLTLISCPPILLGIVFSVF